MELLTFLGCLIILKIKGIKMKKMILFTLMLSTVVFIEAKAIYYRFIKMNMYREFVGVEQVVEREAKKIECFQLKYDNEKRPVEIKHLTKMNECEGYFSGLGEGISLLKIEYIDSIFTVYDSLSEYTRNYKKRETIYTTFNKAKEQVPFRGNVYRMVHSSTRCIEKDNLLQTKGYYLKWSNYDKNGLLCEDLYGVKIYSIYFADESGTNLIESTRTDENGYPVTDNTGIVTIKFQYNDFGKLTFQTNKDIYGKRINSTKGYCEIRIARRDSNDIFTEEYIYYDKDGKLTINQQGVYRVKYFYDSNKYLTSVLFLDTLENVMAGKNDISYSRYIRDKCFYMIKVEYFTSKRDTVKKSPPQLKIAETPMYFLKGYEYQYDKNGFVIEKNEIGEKKENKESGRN